MISANRKDIKLKQALLPTLGELLYAVSLQVKHEKLFYRLFLIKKFKGKLNR